MIAYRHVKRGLDIFGAAAVLIASSPVVVLAGVLVRINLGRPVLFRQDRPGKDGKIFKLYKFRSMKEVDIEAGLISDEDRLTDFGRLLRSSSVDELPSMLNVLKGEMSFVGPRPLLVSYLDRYSGVQRRRHDVRPGITGLAQVNGRNLLAWEDRFRMDIEYVEKMSFRLDVSIILRTFEAVVSRRGVAAVGRSTMEEFQGSDLENKRETLLPAENLNSRES